MNLTSSESVSTFKARIKTYPFQSRRFQLVTNVHCRLYIIIIINFRIDLAFLREEETKASEGHGITSAR